MVPRDEYRLVIHNSVAWGMRRGYGGGFRDELVTQSLMTGTIVAASAFDEVTELFRVLWAWLQVTKQTSRWCYVLGIRRLARRSLRNWG
jgi:hypothetical protein